MPRVFIKTYGCQMNEYDSGKMRALLGKGDYVPTEEPSDADLIIVNTCAIREKPEQKLASFLGTVTPMKRSRPLTVAISGCIAQMQGPKLLRQFPDVDLVFGPDSVHRVHELVEASKNRRIADTDFLSDASAYPFPSDLDPEAVGQVQAFVTIQKGCDNKCTFCVVPATRGAEINRPAEQILEEVRALAERGVRDFTLLGQNVNSYGLKEGGLRFSDLLRQVHAVPGVEMIRYMTSHPRDMGDDVIACYRDLPNLSSHLHLPVQSGSDRVLRRMKRFYTAGRYLEVVEKLKEARPDIVFSTDVITGFPGESDEDFELTMDLLEKVRFEGAFSFKFSPRPGTPALRLMDDAIPDAVAQARLERFQNRQRQIQIEAHQLLDGTQQRVLVAGPSAHDDGVMCGRTSTFKMVNFTGGQSKPGQWVDVRIVRAFANTLRGELTV